jgi:hypothetical protein
MKTILEKPTNVLQPGSKEAGRFKSPRSRYGKGPSNPLRSHDFWQALSAIALSLPHAPVWQRRHD